MTTAAWPPRGRGPARRVRPLATSRAARPPAPRTVQPIQPRLVPQKAGHAWAILVLLAAVGTVMALLLVVSLQRWMEATVQARIIYGALAAGCALTIVLFVVSVVVYVLPRAVGVRRG